MKINVKKFLSLFLSVMICSSQLCFSMEDEQFLLKGSSGQHFSQMDGPLIYCGDYTLSHAQLEAAKNCKIITDVKRDFGFGSHHQLDASGSGRVRGAIENTRFRFSDGSQSYFVKEPGDLLVMYDVNSDGTYTYTPLKVSGGKIEIDDDGKFISAGNIYGSTSKRSWTSLHEEFLKTNPHEDKLAIEKQKLLNLKHDLMVLSKSQSEVATLKSYQEKKFLEFVKKKLSEHGQEVGMQEKTSVIVLQEIQSKIVSLENELHALKELDKQTSVKHKQSIAALNLKIDQLEKQLQGWFVADKDLRQCDLERLKVERDHYTMLYWKNSRESAAQQEYISLLLNEKKNQLRRITNTQKFLETATKEQLSDQGVKLADYISTKKAELHELEKQVARATKAYGKLCTGNTLERQREFLKLTKVQNQYTKTCLEVQELDYDAHLLKQHKSALAIKDAARVKQQAYPVVSWIKSLLAFANIDESYVKDSLPQLLADASGEINKIFSDIQSGHLLSTDKNEWKEALIGFSQGLCDLPGEIITSIDNLPQTIEHQLVLTSKGVKQLILIYALNEAGLVEEATRVREDLIAKIDVRLDAIKQFIESFKESSTRDKSRIITTASGNILISVAATRSLSSALRKIPLGTYSSGGAIKLEQKAAEIVVNRTIKAAEKFEFELPSAVVVAGDVSGTVAGPAQLPVPVLKKMVEGELGYPHAPPAVSTIKFLTSEAKLTSSVKPPVVHKIPSQKPTISSSHIVQKSSSTPKVTVQPKSYVVKVPISKKFAAQTKIPTKPAMPAKPDITVHAKVTPAIKSPETVLVENATTAQKGKALAQPSMARSKVEKAEKYKISVENDYFVNETVVPKNQIQRLSSKELYALEKSISFNFRRTKHMFRDVDGHFKYDIPQNRRIILNTVKEKYYLGSDKHGNHWFARLDNKGHQFWASIRDGKICNGGVNNVPLKYNSETGFCRLFK